MRFFFVKFFCPIFLSQRGPQRERDKGGIDVQVFSRFFKGIDHTKFKNAVIICAPSCLSKSLWRTFFCGRLKNIFWRMLVTKPFQFQKNEHSSKCLLLCSAEKRMSYRFCMTRGWVNDFSFLNTFYTFSFVDDPSFKESLNALWNSLTWAKAA